MSEKPSRLLTTAQELIKNQNLNDAIVICEEVIKLDPNNIKGLLLAAKCWMDLDINYENAKHSLEKILTLKPNNPTAIQGLRKFYEKNFDLYFDDALDFFRNLFNTNELIDKDFDTITKAINKPYISIETQNFICDCLILRIKTHKDINSLKILFQIGAENFIIDKNRFYFDKFVELISEFNSDSISSDTDELDYLKAMETLFKAFIDKMEPEFFFTLMDKNNMTNIYGYALFAEILCDHYLFSDCHDTIDLGFTRLESEKILNKEAFHRVLIILQIKNFIQWLQVDGLKHHWPENAIEFVPKYLWCQAYAIGFDGFGQSGILWANVADDWCLNMQEHQSIICRAIMNGQKEENLHRDQEMLVGTNFSSFEWFLWSGILKASNLFDKQEEVLHLASKHSPVHFKIHETLAEIYSHRNDYKLAVSEFWLALDKHFCPEILEALVDLHMSVEKYDQPIEILDKLEVENCSESLLEKFVMCLNYLDRVTDAISTAQRLAKQYPNNGHNWQLLGDLYLKRGNINSAFTTYSKSIELTGESSDIYARMGNVFSMKFQQTFDENDFHQSICFFDKSITLKSIDEALEGKASVLYLHAEMSLRQLMLSCAVSDVQHIIDLLIDCHSQLSTAVFYMNLLGKTIFLSINGRIDNLINFKHVAMLFKMNPQEICDPYEIASSCFRASIRNYPTESESYFNDGLLCLHKLNNQCSSLQRGNALNSDLYTSIEENFKSALHLDSNLHEAWKYLGYLYFRHGIVTSRRVFQIQHCLSTAINITSTTDTLKDPESAFLLGLLYVRENWCNLAKELFAKMEMDYSVNPIGHIGMYLLAAQDHTITEQSHIAKAILCYNYRDEESNLDDSCYRINDSIVGLFCDNLGFLVNSRDHHESFDKTNSELISALKTALNNSWINYEAHKAIGSSICPLKQKQYQEYEFFLGILELLTGNYQWGKQLMEKSKLVSENTLVTDLQKLNESWINMDLEQCLVDMKNLMKHPTVSMEQGSSIADTCDDPSRPTRQIDRLLLTSITQYLSSSQSELITSLESLIGKFSSICDNENFTFEMQTSIIMSSGALTLSTRNHSVVNMFIDAMEKYFPKLDDKVESFSRLFCRLKAIETSSKDAFKYMHNHCLKQPFDMDRWLNLLEFGLEYSDNLHDFVDISKIFYITNRPWCFSPFDIERYAKILQRHSTILTASAVSHQKHMIMRSMKLFPHLCFDWFKSLFLFN